MPKRSAKPRPLTGARIKEQQRRNREAMLISRAARSLGREEAEARREELLAVASDPARQNGRTAIAQRLIDLKKPKVEEELQALTEKVNGGSP